MTPLAFLVADIDEAERNARLRELRALALIFLGKSNPVTIALGEALVDPNAIDDALHLLDGAPTLKKRRLLSAYVALLP